MNLGDAKWAVHRNLSPQVGEAAEDLWTDLLEGMRQFQVPSTDSDSAR